MIDVFYIVVVLGVVLVSMTIHEVMHGYAAYLLGDDTAKIEGRLTLNPIRHIDPFFTILLPVLLAVIGAPVFGGAKPVPINPYRLRYDEWGSALVAAAGPLTNLFLAFVFAAVYALLGAPQGNLVHLVYETAIKVNLGFFVFNSIPFPPLDGSRVLYALAPDFARRGMEFLEQYGILILFMVIFLAQPVIGAYMVGAINFFLATFNHIFGLSLIML